LLVIATAISGNLAGIRNEGMAWDRMLIAPTVAGNLTGVEATVGTVRGAIKVKWTASDSACGEGAFSIHAASFFFFVASNLLHSSALQVRRVMM